MTREESIKVLQRMKYPYKCNKRKMMISNVDRDNEALDMAIKALSQEPCRYWQNGKCNGNTEVCDDAINRDAVREILAKYHLGESRIAEELNELPSVQHNSNADKKHVENTLDDAISRDAVLSKIKEVCFSQEWTQFRLDKGSNGQRDFIIDYIEQLPSIT